MSCLMYGEIPKKADICMLFGGERGEGMGICLSLPPFLFVCLFLFSFGLSSPVESLLSMDDAKYLKTIRLLDFIKKQTK